jgi:peptidyl-prolyl cis-trans isomerase SurA
LILSSLLVLALAADPAPAVVPPTAPAGATEAPAAGSPAASAASPGLAPAAVAPVPAAAPVAATAASPSRAAPATAAAPPGAPAAPRVVLNRVAATVNGEVVTQQELELRAGDDWKRASAGPPGPERDRAVALALRRAFEVVVAEKLFHAQAVTLGMEVTDEQVKLAIDDIKKRNNADDKTLDQMLAAQGMNRAEFREQIRGQLESYNVLSAKVRSKVKLSEDDVKNYYQKHPGEFGGEEELHVRHILIPLAEGAQGDEVARAQAAGEAARRRVTGGEPFAEVAKELSKGPGATDGGDLGWLRRGTMQRSLEEVVLALKDGEVSPLVRAGPGLHLFKVEERRIGGGKSFEAAKEEIRDRMTLEQTQAYREQYLAELKRDAVLDIRIPELKD